MNRRILAASLFVTWTAVHAQGARPFAVAKDEQTGSEIAARFDGTKCADVVKVSFVASSADHFKSGLPLAGRLLNNATTIIRQQCPILTRVTVRGAAGGRIVYSGLSEAATNWAVVELGSSTSSGLLSSGAAGSRGSGPSAQELYGRASGFLPAPKFAAMLKAAPTLCIRPDANGASCAGINEFEIRSDSDVQIAASYRLDEAGATAALTYPAQNKAGFLCTNPKDAKIKVSGGSLTVGGRADMESMLLERIQGAGHETCTGFQAVSSSELNTESFNSEGSSITQRTAARLVTQRPSLRLDK